MEMTAINTSESSCPEYEVTLTTVLTSTSKHIDELQVIMTSYQETRLAELRAELKSEMRAELTELQSIASDLRAGLEHKKSEVASIKEGLAKECTSEPSVAAGKILDIENTLANHERQTDYLENQSRRNNLRIGGIPEERVSPGMILNVSVRLTSLTH